MFPSTRRGSVMSVLVVEDAGFSAWCYGFTVQRVKVRRTPLSTRRGSAHGKASRHSMNMVQGTGCGSQALGFRIQE